MMDNPEHVGKVLTKHYPTKTEAEKLLKAGDLVNIDHDGAYQPFNFRPGEKTHATETKNYLRLKDLGEQLMVEYIYVYSLEGSIDCHKMT